MYKQTVNQPTFSNRTVKFNNNNNIYLYRANSTIQFSNGYNIHKPGLKTGMESGTFWKTEIGLTG